MSHVETKEAVKVVLTEHAFHKLFDRLTRVEPHIASERRNK